MIEIEGWVVFKRIGSHFSFINNLIWMSKIMKILFAVLLMVTVTCGAAYEFAESSIKNIFQEKKDSFILFSESAQQDVRDQFILSAEADDSGLYYSYLNKGNNADHFKRFAEYLGVDITNTPVIVFITQGAQKYLYASKDINKHSLLEFVTRVKAGQVSRLLKSAPIPEKDEGFVKVLVGKNFKDVVFNDEREYLVKFYAPWCGHCKQMAPDYEAAAKTLAINPNIVMAKVDGSLNEVEGVELTGYPTLWFFPRDKTADPLRFNGERNKQGIIDWLRDHTEYEWIEPEGNQEL